MVVVWERHGEVGGRRAFPGKPAVSVYTEDRLELHVVCN